MTDTQSGSELQRIVALTRELASAAIDQDERDAALRCIIDAVGCALGGSRDGTARRTAAAFPNDRGDAAVSLIGTGQRVAARDALLVNAAAIRTLDFNDVYSARNNHHPSESVIPIALAVAEREAWSGVQLIDAVAIGYRISLTLGELWSGLLAAGWAPAASLGQISNAAFLGILFALDDRELADAIATAAVTAPALAVVFRGELSDTKSLVSGFAAHAAWQAVQLARAGVSGPGDVFEGSAGYDKMVGGRPELDTPARLDARVVQHKAFPTVFTIHAAIEAALSVRAALGAEADDVLTDPTTRIEVRVPPKTAEMAGATARWAPKNRESAQFSLPFGVATALLIGRCGADDLEAAVTGATAAQTTELVSRMTVVPDQGFGGYTGGRVAVTTGGRREEAEVGEPHGSAANPLSLGEIEAKFIGLAAAGRSAEFADHALGALRGLATTPDIRVVLRELAVDATHDEVRHREAQHGEAVRR